MLHRERYILLSFDVEEFDLPLEYQQPIALQEQLAIGYSGFVRMKELLATTKVPSTLYTTAVFADNFKEEIKELSHHHEIASHTYSHTVFQDEDLFNSRIKLEEITGNKIIGLRMQRMKTVAAELVKNAGHTYNSSINPTWIPGRYNNLSEKRTFSVNDNFTTLPVSVSPTLRIPLFWLAFKNFPYGIFLHLAKQTLKKDGYINLYFHPWELTERICDYKLPSYVKSNPEKLFNKIYRLVSDLMKEGDFTTTSAFLNHKGYSN